jgi:hypothetical protein
MKISLRPRPAYLTRRTVAAGLWSLVAADAAAAAGSAPGRSAGVVRTTYEATQISAGENGPRLDTSDQGLCEILAGLHRKSPPGQIAERLSMPSAAFAKRLDALMAEGLVHRDARGRLLPSIPVVTLSDAAQYMQPGPAEVATIADAICAHDAQARAEFAALDAVKDINFRDLSLLLYSDVLMDNWQIDDVEREFLQAPRPLRRGGRYYFSIFEILPDQKQDAYGIYGNHSLSVGSTDLHLYGNARYTGRPNLVTLPKVDVQATFGFPATTTVQQAQLRLVQGLAALARRETSGLTDAAIEGLHAYGLIDQRGRTLVPMFSSDEDQALYRIAGGFRPTLISILNGRRRELQRRFSNTPYDAEGVSFNEWFIWYYHFMYTAVTNELVARGLINLPPGHVVTYLGQSS